VTSTPAGITCGTSCSATYASGTALTLTAAPATGSTFTGWSGGGCSGTGTCTVTLNAATTVTATFGVPSFALTVSKAGAGSGTVTSTPPGITCGTTCAWSYPSGTVVTLTATPAADSTFAGWSGGCSGTGTCTKTLSAATAVTATFELTITPTANQTFTSTPTAITCGTNCSASYPSGTVVTLTATPAADSTFAGWSGGGCTGTGACTVTLSAATAVTATFDLQTTNPQTISLTVNNEGSGNGKVISLPVGINCGTTCTASYASGTVVTLTADPAGNSSTFMGWSGGGCTGTDFCTVTMTDATTVIATFSKNRPVNRTVPQ